MSGIPGARMYSGHMKYGVPSTSSCEVIAAVSCMRTRPKSISLTCPSRVTSTFSGFTSRCTRPSESIAARAPAIPATYHVASRGGSGASRSAMSLSVQPSTSSMVKYSRPRYEPTS